MERYADRLLIQQTIEDELLDDLNWPNLLEHTLWAMCHRVKSHPGHEALLGELRSRNHRLGISTTVERMPRERMIIVKMELYDEG